MDDPRSKLDSMDFETTRLPPPVLRYDLGAGRHSESACPGLDSPEFDVAPDYAGHSSDLGHGQVFWITGLSGAGKTTVAAALCARLRSAGRAVIFLDGDHLRSVIADDLQHDGASRRRSAMRNARLCRMLSDQGYDVVCATISLFHEVQHWNRTSIPRYCEILLAAPQEELERRDAKGIYAKFRRGEVLNVVGLDVQAELPKAPDLVIDNHGDVDATAAVEAIWRRFCKTESPSVPPRNDVVRFGTKAETLAALAPRLHSACVLPQVRFSVAEWQTNPATVLDRIGLAPWSLRPVIVRSSARGEDGPITSQAGRYATVAGVTGLGATEAGIRRVIASYDNGGRPDDQVFVQPMLEDVTMAGVAFSRCPNGDGPYFVINYDDRSGRTDVVTAGAGDDLKTFFCLRSNKCDCPERLQPVIALIEELEDLLACSMLDIEFAVDGRAQVYLLQVRPLTVEGHDAVPADDALVDSALSEVARKVELLSRPIPFLHGSRTIFGVMPDWNPAEIIGLRPRPLSLSLYRELITDSIWAYQRDNYGYQNLRSFPLLVSFHGLPYIDVRVSFNSFVPRDVPDGLADRLVNYYIKRLADEPHLHDKVEFDIIFSCYTLDLPQRMATLRDHGFAAADLDTLSDCLLRLTNRIIHGQDGLWQLDSEKIDLLTHRLPDFHTAHIDKIARIYWLLEDCKRYGTLPFAGLARSGFIAAQLLRSFIDVGIIDTAEHGRFMASVDTIGTRIGRDFTRMTKQEFLAQYGHLRPGTYDILSPRYDEDPDLYFDWSNRAKPTAEPAGFSFSAEQLRAIDQRIAEHRLDIDATHLIEFIKTGIEGREYAKFVFTRNLSDALSLIATLGQDYGISKADCAFLNYDDIRWLYSRSGSVGERLRASVARGKREYRVTKRLVMPPLIMSPSDVFAFHLPPTEQNFITQESVTAPTRTLDDPPATLAGCILLVPSADPGFDWIFSRGIVGFVTQFGGANSHMAIRAGELGIPAVIGAGDALFQRWQSARKLRIDCGNKTVQIIA